ncbi:hypothetical protein KVV02_002750 [Mortierella alpina]|uniref:Transcription regulator Rua1 C-terminal domain-containing protein n=1 Tax=Mortierella alpina TaxID=64518 RepID=A0A9P8CV33_MORAP|nr:hypothetical protein KVV02_002750 [Mortierella alpina]
MVVMIYGETLFNASVAVARAMDPGDLSSTAIFEHTILLDLQQDHGQTSSDGPHLDMMMEHPQQPMDLRQFQPQQQQPMGQPHADSLPSSSSTLVPIPQSITSDSVHPFHTASGSSSDAFHVQTTLSQTHAVAPRPFWFENTGLTHRASYPNLLSMGREERLRARQDRGSIISLASTVGDESPPEFNAFDADASLGSELHSQQSSSNGLGYEGEDCDHQSIGVGLALMNFLDFNAPQSHSSPGDTSDVGSAQPSRSNSIMMDPSNMVKVGPMFDLTGDSLRMQSGSPSAAMHPLSKEPLQRQDGSRDSIGLSQPLAPGQHPNETEGMLPSMWSGSMDMLSSSVHPFAIPPYIEDRSHPFSGATDPTLLENNTNSSERESLAQQVLQQQQQLNHKMYAAPSSASNFGVGKVSRIRNRTISSPAGSFQYSPSSMAAASANVNVSRPPSGLSFGPIPVRERKRSLMDANMAQGLDQLRQSLPSMNHSAAPSSSDTNHLTTSSGTGSNGNNNSSEDLGGLSSPFNVKQEPVDQSLVGLGLGESSSSDAPPEEAYHRKRTKSVDMYSSYMGSMTSFSPSNANSGMPTSMDMTSSIAPNQGTSIQNWQPPDMALHLQVYHNSMQLNGLGSAMPSSSVPMHMQMNGQGHPHPLSSNGMGPESNLYHLQNLPMSEHGHTLRHSISHDRIIDPMYGRLPHQSAAVKPKSRPKVPKAAAGKASKAKGRSMSMGDALDPDNSSTRLVGFGEESEEGAAGGATQTPGEDDASNTEFEGREIHGDPKARKQKLRYEGDQYTPQWVRNAGQAKEGFCDTCVPGKWLQLKNSAFWYHKQFFHGISSVSGKLFANPIQTRQMEQDDIEGLCHQCNEWIPISNHKRQNSMLWYRHAHKCHIYHKPKIQGQGSARSSFSAGQPLPAYADGLGVGVGDGQGDVSSQAGGAAASTAAAAAIAAAAAVSSNFEMNTTRG